ncbi:hypothetical protein M404DRAFT_488985 [Pisolithus tinctorius Marx 270]|uniref:Uncharacterized protein n=1 Tax=Pisolithus tinctorius Marx 270 TaxID=870435 RepID=A0A0C3JAC0_PISTI|nr:hypothetical protein M404DRAFT_488985 [Pisolithus tinctorius Marx 270]
MNSTLGCAWLVPRCNEWMRVNSSAQDERSYPGAKMHSTTVHVLMRSTLEGFANPERASDRRSALNLRDGAATATPTIELDL